jgi:single-strand DNA-binding protein
MSTRSLNKVMLIGNLTRDPNLRYTPNGTSVCSFGLATNRTWTPAEGGDKVEKAEFHNVVAWGKLADICGQLLHKGDKAYVDGRIQTRDWKTEDGQDRRITEIVIDNMMLLSSRSGATGGYQSDEMEDYGDADQNPAPRRSSKKAAQPQQDEAMDDDVSQAEDISDDIPF